MQINNLIAYGSIIPKVAENSFVAPGSYLIGDVILGEKSSIWFNCVVRGDIDRVLIGEASNIQDGTVIHTNAKDGPTIVGKGVVVGHQCLLHACTLEDHSLIGMGSVVMDYAKVETGGWLAAGSLLPPNKVIGNGELWMGRPAKYIRKVSSDETATIRKIVDNYVVRAKQYKMSLDADSK